MTKAELIHFWESAQGKDRIFFHQRFGEYLKNMPEEPEMPRSDVKTPSSGLRTVSQHNALFLWFSMIEHEAENAGITWNQVVGQTHQLKITKEGLHVMAKQLSEALWGIKSTKDLKKIGHIDDLVDHFVDLFSKVGLTLPSFPSDEGKHNQRLKALDMARDLQYPPNNLGGDIF